MGQVEEKEPEREKGGERDDGGESSRTEGDQVAQICVLTRAINFNF